MKSICAVLGAMAGGLLVVGTGCVSAAKKPVYDSSQTSQIIREQRGEIVAVKDVVITPANVGAIYGGGPGRRIGSAVGRGVITGSVIGVAAAVGSVVGGEIGSKADEKAGEEITIRLAGTEEIIIVVQERGEMPLAVGEPVRVQTGSARRPIGSSSGGSVRVVRDNFHASAEGVLTSERPSRGELRVVSQ